MDLTEEYLALFGVEWDTVAYKHNTCWPNTMRDEKSVKSKFQKLELKPTGNQSCPPHV